MNTALATQDQQSLVLPNEQNRREVLLTKINGLKTNNLTAKEKENLDELMHDISFLFMKLCWSKLGVSTNQLKNLAQSDLEELGLLIYEKSRITALIQTLGLILFPIGGWILLLVYLSGLSEYSFERERSSFMNMRYFWWYRRIQNRHDHPFSPKV